jgi:hypothetical protein
MDEGRKRVLVIAAAILIARHLKDRNLNSPSPAMEALIADAIGWAERILRKIDRVVAE